MPFESESQRRYMWARHPNIAEAWAHGKSSVTGKRDTKGRGAKGGYRNLPRHKSRSSGRRR
jgi:hypothetical protein